MSNFSFSHSVFYPFGELSATFIKFEIVVWKLFKFRRVQNLLFGKGLTLSQMTNFRLLQTLFADDNFEFDKNGRKFSKWVENTVGKGEIARLQFLLLPQCFQETFTTDT